MDPIYITFTCHLHTLYGIKTQWFRHKKYLRHTDALFKLIPFLLFSLKPRVLTLPVPTGTQQQSRVITTAPLPVLTVEQWPCSAQRTKRAFHFQGNDFLNKNVNALKCSIFLMNFYFSMFPTWRIPGMARNRGFKSPSQYFCSAFMENEVGRTGLWLKRSANQKAFCTVAADQR